MGVHTKEETETDNPVKLKCVNETCGIEFWTDSTMLNDCPECAVVSMDVVE